MAIAAALAGAPLATPSCVAPPAQALEHLYLDEVHATAACLEPLALLTQLRHLRLLGNGLGDACLEPVLALLAAHSCGGSGPVLPSPHGPAGCDGVAAVTADGGLRGLESLSLCGNGLTFAGMSLFLERLTQIAASVRPRAAFSGHPLCVRWMQHPENRPST
jgi:hypothetical protein